MTTLRAVAKRLVDIVGDPRRFPGATGAHDQWLREVMNDRVAERLARLPPERSEALEISGDLHASRPWKSYESIHWPEFDICAADLDLDRTFDVVIAEQVLEHVVDPWQAVANLRRLCRPGGLVVTTTPFMIRKHDYPEDYWRFSEAGMRVLLERAGLEVEDIASWGNRQAVVGNLKRWSRRRRWQSLSNDPRYPTVVWAFAHPPSGP